jgi:histidyl-tRNA synthetase
MTRGRRREHYQWNLDVWGVDELTAEVELLSAAVSFMRSVGLTASDVGIKLSTRTVLSEILSSIGVPDEKFASTCVLVDKLDKMPADDVKKMLLEQGLPADSAEKLLSILAISDFDALEAAMGADSPAVMELRRLFELAEAYGLSDWIVLDLGVVRGLAYYTGTVFEGFDRSGELRAIFGGGRYDKLLSTFGGEDLAAAGFGFGDAVIVELLRAKNLLPDLSAIGSGAVLVACQDDELRPVAMRAARSMREAGIKVDFVLEPKKMKWIFKQADRVGVDHVVLFAPREAEEGLARVKRMADGEQEEVPIAELAEWFLKQKPATP